MSLDATLENICAELIQRSAEKNRLYTEMEHAKTKHTEAEKAYNDCLRVIGETYKPTDGRYERRLAFGRILITISKAGDVKVEQLESLK